MGYSPQVVCGNSKHYAWWLRVTVSMNSSAYKKHCTFWSQLRNYASYRSFLYTSYLNTPTPYPPNLFKKTVYRAERS